MARAKINRLGYWYAIDTPETFGKVRHYSTKNTYGGYTDPGAQKVREELQKQHAGTVRVWPVEAADFTESPLKDWSAKRERLELMIAEANGTFAPSAEYLAKHEQPKELPGYYPGDYKEWSKAKRDNAAAEMIADGRFQPTAEWLAKNPQVEAKAALFAAEPATKAEPVTQTAKKASAVAEKARTIAAKRERAPKLAEAVETRQEPVLQPRGTFIPTAKPKKRRAKTQSWAFAWLGGVN